METENEDAIDQFPELPEVEDFLSVLNWSETTSKKLCSTLERIDERATPPAIETLLPLETPEVENQGDKDKVEEEEEEEEEEERLTRGDSDLERRGLDPVWLNHQPRDEAPEELKEIVYGGTSM